MKKITRLFVTSIFLSVRKFVLSVCYMSFYFLILLCNVVLQLSSCPRSVLDTDRVLYIDNDEDRRQFELVCRPCTSAAGTSGAHPADANKQHDSSAGKTSAHSVCCPSSSSSSRGEGASTSTSRSHLNSAMCVSVVGTGDEAGPGAACLAPVAPVPGGQRLWCSAVTGLPVSTGPKGWIFVVRNDKLFACEKRTTCSAADLPLPPDAAADAAADAAGGANSFSPLGQHMSEQRTEESRQGKEKAKMKGHGQGLRFHHSSFFAGQGVHAAGMLVLQEGVLQVLYPHSGHYRPHDRHLCSLLKFLLHKMGPQALASMQVDVQRVMKASRQSDKGWWGS